MAQNPFDNDHKTFFALVNHELEYSLWPTFKSVPEGWTIAHGNPDGLSRSEVLDWIERTWSDLRPASLRMKQTSAEQSSRTVP
ncbi:MbtH protein [Brevibacterium sp. Mu109]|uniref:MbtH family protein n=1 Tax=Brevibacterium sp. Mu109 TaxID=1255669 RepID=UPI000C64AA4C|nr:MbtH family protein [Brevibacterium sp. Mu109]MDN5895656.1 MbtH family NRPS accessory protein [Nocardioides sp.]SMX87004.1 MbtH protein [Brevibacterium sp. Mu109]